MVKETRGRRRKPIQELDESGSVIREFDYLERAVYHLPISNKSCHRILKGEVESIKGIRIRYKSQEDIDKDEAKARYDKSRIANGKDLNTKFVWRGKPLKDPHEIKIQKEIDNYGDRYMDKVCPRCKRTHSTLCDGQGVAYKRLCTVCGEKAKRHNEGFRQMNGAFTPV